MQQLTFEIKNKTDYQFLLELAKRMRIKIRGNEPSDKELTSAGILLSESSLAKDWENEDDNYWGSFLTKKSKKK